MTIQNIQQLFLDTYSEKNKNIFKDYQKTKTLMGSELDRAEIHRRTGISINKLSNWVRTKKRIPFIYRCFSKANKRGYFDLNMEKLEDLSYLMGYVFGDGNITNCKCKTSFFGVSTDLPKINETLKEFDVHAPIRKYKINNGKMTVCDNAFTRLLIALGCPIGL